MQNVAGEIKHPKQKLNVISKANAIILPHLCELAVFPTLESQRPMWKGVTCFVTFH